MARREVTLPGVEVLRERRRLPGYIDFWVRLIRDKPLGAFGGFLVLVVIVLAVGADIIAPFGYNDLHLGDRLQSYGGRYLLGTDQLGRDLLSRVIFGARISMYVGLGVTIIGAVFSTLIGVSSAYIGGAFDSIMQRIVDAWMSFPLLVILLALMAIMGPGMLSVIIVLGLAFSFVNARVARGAALSVKENIYVEAARAIGAGHLRIVLLYILPNIMAPIIILATFSLGQAILIEATLSFLGMGIPPPTPSWGGMLSFEGRSYMIQAPHIAIWPGIALSVAVFGFNMFGDALRDLLDPRLRGGGAGRF